jgi:hypothetical protein
MSLTDYSCRFYVNFITFEIKIIMLVARVKLNEENIFLKHEKYVKFFDNLKN